MWTHNPLNNSSNRLNTLAWQRTKKMFNDDVENQTSYAFFTHINCL